MSSSEITKQLQSLRQNWRNNNFVFSLEQQKKYDKLSSQRREFIQQWKTDGRIATATTSKAKKEDKKNDQKRISISL